MDLEIFNPDFLKQIPKQESFNALKTAFIDSMDLNCAGLKKAGVFFSAGIDSALIAKAVSERISHVQLFTVGLKDSQDLLFSERIAEEMNLKLNKRIVKESELKKFLLQAEDILGFSNRLQLQIAIPLLIGCIAVKKSKFKTVFCGQGADELFLGYSRFKTILKESGYKGVQDYQRELLQNYRENNLYRDEVISHSQEIDLRMPFLEKNFVLQSLAFSSKDNLISVDDPLRKHILRKLGKEFSLPIEVIERKKKAIQFGSGIAKKLKKLY